MSSKVPVKKKRKVAAKDVLENYQVIELNCLVPADWNYKEDDEELQKTLEENIRRNGQIENIIVRKIGPALWEVVNGNHRLKGFKNVGFETAVCYDLGEVSLEEAKRVAVETNETRFMSDKVKLAQRIAELTQTYTMKELSVTMPYSEQEMNNTIQILNFDWTDKSNHVRCPQCKKEFKAQ